MGLLAGAATSAARRPALNHRTDRDGGDAVRRHDSSRRARVLLRGWSLATLCVAAGAGSHAVVSGHAPGPAALAVAWALTGLVCVLLAGRGLARTPVAAGVLAAQAALHWLMAHGAHAQLAGSAGGHAGHDVVLSPPTAPSSGAEPAMLAGHLLAALLTYAAIRRGEAAVAAFVRCAGVAVRWLAGPAARPVAVPLPRPLPVRSFPRPVHALPLPGAAPVRGPPVVVS